jgi:hypothetical protein
MAIEIISLTPKGGSLTHSVRDFGTPIEKSVVHFIGRMGGRTTFDRICMFKFGGDSCQAKRVLSSLKAKGIIVGE